MPRNLIGDPPFAPVLLFDENRDFTVDDLYCIARERPNGVSICIRYPEGPPKRGGYFFHVVPTSNQDEKFNLYDFESRLITEFTSEALTKFINHCTGRRFDEPVFTLCQTDLNFLKDAEADASASGHWRYAPVALLPLGSRPTDICRS